MPAKCRTWGRSAARSSSTEASRIGTPDGACGITGSWRFATSVTTRTAGRAGRSASGRWSAAKSSCSLRSCGSGVSHPSRSLPGAERLPTPPPCRPQAARAAWEAGRPGRSEPPLPLSRREKHTAGRLRTAGRMCFQSQLGGLTRPLASSASLVRRAVAADWSLAGAGHNTASGAGGQ
jgi:hypothetical protein